MLCLGLYVCQLLASARFEIDIDKMIPDMSRKMFVTSGRHTLCGTGEGSKHDDVGLSWIILCILHIVAASAVTVFLTLLCIGVSTLLMFVSEESLIPCFPSAVLPVADTWMPWLSFAGMADWVEQRKLSFADSFYYKTTDQTDRMSRMTNMSSSPQCDPLVARDSSFLSGEFHPRLPPQYT